MNNRGYVEPQLDLKELLFRLLSQWKAMLLTALIFAVAVSGLKLFKDIRTDGFDTTEITGDAPIEEQEAAIIEELGDDYLLVSTVLQQERLVNQQNKYLNESAIMKIDSANAKTMVFTFFVSGAEAETPKVFAHYKVSVLDKNFLIGLKDAVGIDLDDKYTRELQSVSYETFSENEVVNSGTITYRVRIAETSDEDEVRSYVESAFSAFNDEISKEVAPHLLEVLNVENVRLYDTDLFNKKVSIINNINSLQNAIRTNKNNFNEDQKNAYSTLRDIRNKENEIFEEGEYGIEGSSEGDLLEEETEIKKPGISVKYILLGFILGAFIYAFIYFMLMVLKNKVRSASDAETYAGARVLGEVYRQGSHSGIGKLLHSGIVERALYGGLFDAEKQISRAVSSIAAICENKEIKNITLLNIGPQGDEITGVINDINAKLKLEDVDVNVVNLDKEIDEKTLVGVENAVMVVTADDTSSSLLVKTADILREFGIDCIGTVYNQVI